MSYVLRVVSLMCLNVVSLRKFNISTKFTMQCDEWLLWACIRPLRGQVRHVSSKGCSIDVMIVVLEHDVKKLFKVLEISYCHI